jgi:hypothetical protein
MTFILQPHIMSGTHERISMLWICQKVILSCVFQVNHSKIWLIFLHPSQPRKLFTCSSLSDMFWVSASWVFTRVDPGTPMVERTPSVKINPAAPRRNSIPGFKYCNWQPTHVFHKSWKSNFNMSVKKNLLGVFSPLVIKFLIPL